MVLFRTAITSPYPPFPSLKEEEWIEMREETQKLDNAVALTVFHTDSSPRPRRYSEHLIGKYMYEESY